MNTPTCLQVDGQAGPGGHAGPGGGDEAGAGRCRELSPGRRQPGSSAGEASISSNSLHGLHSAIRLQ